MQKKRFLLILLFMCINIMTVTMSVDAAKKSLKAPITTLSNVASTGKIKVSWGKITGAKSYKVYVSSNKGKTWKCLKTTSGLSITHTSAAAGKTYYYKVKAIATKASANSAYSKVKNRTCDLARPVVNVSTVRSTGKIKLSWKAVSKAVSYDVYRSKDGGKTWVRISKTKKNKCDR